MKTKKVIVEKKHNLARRIVEGLAIGFGISIGADLPNLIAMLLLKF